jgi:hypothetical protein
LFVHGFMVFLGLMKIEVECPWKCKTGVGAGVVGLCELCGFCVVGFLVLGFAFVLGRCVGCLLWNLDFFERVIVGLCADRVFFQS